MMLQAWKSKLCMGALCIFFLLFVTLIRTAPARGQSSPFDFSPGPGLQDRTGEVSGIVYLDKDSRPAGQVIVNIRSLSSGLFRSALTDFDGRFEMRGLPLGAYQISVGERGYESAQTIAQVNVFPTEVALHLNSSRSTPSGANGYTVSVRQLSIPMKAQDQFYRGLERLSKQDPAGSLSYFSKAAATFPDYYEAYYHLGVAEMKLGHLDEAEQAFQKAIDLSGGRYAPAQFAYGLLLCRQGHPAEGERIIRAGLDANANAPQGHVFLGVALVAQNRLEEAEKSAREALLRAPKFADAYLVLSDIHARRNDYRAQLQDLNAYLKLASSGAESEFVSQARETAKRLAAESAPRN
jgi:tetratricopeptide (TPR) repeat protein